MCACVCAFVHGHVHTLYLYPSFIYAGDDCCAGWEYLQELAVVYRMMKEIDPYHLTAGALECGEMHAFQEPQLRYGSALRDDPCVCPEPVCLGKVIGFIASL